MRGILSKNIQGFDIRFRCDEHREVLSKLIVVMILNRKMKNMKKLKTYKNTVM